MLLRAGTVNDATGPVLTFLIDGLRQVEVRQHAVAFTCSVYSFERCKK